MVRAASQPWFGASMIVQIRAAIAVVDSATPARSGGGVCGSREVGTLTAVSAPASAATGARAKNTLGHE
jgi:hypothetical protein